MTISDPSVKAVSFEQNRMSVELSDGRSIAVPLDWFPRLKNASMDVLKQWVPVAAGRGIHWPLLDEDISVAGLLHGQNLSSLQNSELRKPN